MLKPDKSPRARFIYFTGCANTLLKCRKDTIKDIFPDHDYCVIDYYRRTEKIHEISIKLEIEGVTLLCDFDENDKCYSCSVCFDKTDDADIYKELCSSFFEYNALSELWVMYSSYASYRQKDGEWHLIFFSIESLHESEAIP